MRARLLPLVAATAVAALAVPALAAPTGPAPQIVDTVGDANGLNGQGFEADLPASPPDTATAPADYAAADIVSVQFATLYKTKVVRKGRKRVPVKTPTDTTVTLNLSAAPTNPEMFYRVVVTMPGCDQLFIEYGTDVATGGSTVRCPSGSPTTASKTFSADAAVKGNSIVWTIPVTEIPAGTVFSNLEAQTRFNPAAVTAPQIDYAASAKTFTVGK